MLKLGLCRISGMPDISGRISRFAGYSACRISGIRQVPDIRQKQSILRLFSLNFYKIEKKLFRNRKCIFQFSLIFSAIGKLKFTKKFAEKFAWKKSISGRISGKDAGFIRYPATPDIRLRQIWNCNIRHPASGMKIQIRHNLTPIIQSSLNDK